MSPKGGFLAGWRAGGGGGRVGGSKRNEVQDEKALFKAKAVNQVELQGPTGESLSSLKKKNDLTHEWGHSGSPGLRLDPTLRLSSHQRGPSRTLQGLPRVPPT